MKADAEWNRDSSIEGGIDLKSGTVSRQKAVIKLNKSYIYRVHTKPVCLTPIT